ncbi:hypothetical protein [Agrobacterium vitis]|uniref:hypothetical protein n=1 Tax=Agrobacterium vitis TaxID=373 RepID=UPI0015D9BD07|nr:hypothetical protein [Agrobacterium vitis]
MIAFAIFIAALLDPVKIVGGAMIAFFGLKSSKVVWKRLIFIFVAECALIWLTSLIIKNLGGFFNPAHIVASFVWLFIFLVPFWKRQHRRDLIRIADEKEFGVLPPLE